MGWSLSGETGCCIVILSAFYIHGLVHFKSLTIKYVECRGR